MVQQFCDVRIVLGVHDRAELAIRHGDEDSFGRSLPHRGPTFELDGPQPGQEVDDRRPLRLRVLENPKLAIEVVQPRHKQADNALAAEVGGGDDIDDELDPGPGLATVRRNERVEAERRYRASNRVDPEIGSDLQEISVATLPIESDHPDAAGHDALHQHEREVGLAGTAPTGDQDVLFESDASQQKRIHLTVPVRDPPNRYISGSGKLSRRWPKGSPVWLIIGSQVLCRQQL